MPTKSLASKLKGVKREPKRESPLWKGPEEGGITQSLLSRFLVCRERFRLLVVEGLKPQDSFQHRLEYGQMWHTCEEAHANNADHEKPLRDYCTQLCKRYPIDQTQISHWYNVCKVQFPEYVKHWAKHPDVKDRTPLLQEYAFCVPYKLPSGRVVKLRGKWDSVDLIGSFRKGKGGRTYLQENKTKGDVNEVQLKNQLQFDLQTMIYLTALDYHLKNYDNVNNSLLGGDYGPPAGVRYNVVRRPLSGGKGSIRKHAPTKKNPRGESDEEFYERLRKDYIAEDPGYFFMRWKAEVSQADIKRFEKEFLQPILEQLCDWWEWISKSDDPFSPNDGCENQLDQSVRSSVHWRTPFGFYNTLAEGRSTELDEYLATGSMLGLQRADELFPELT